MTTNIKTLLLGITIAATFSACSSGESKNTTVSAVRVETYLPTVVQDNGIFISGMASAKQTAMISTRMMGFVDKIYVKQGDPVKKGQLLMVINSDDLKAKKAQAEAMVTEAEAAFKNARRDYERYKTLHSQNSVSDKELENMELNQTSIKAKLQMARQTLNEVNAMLTYTNIRAPFSGTVTQRMIDEGSTANPGMPLLNIDQLGELDIKASVPENYVSEIKVGDSVKVEIKSLGKQMNGKVSELSSSSALNGGQYGIRIAIDPKEKENLRSGMYASIFIPGKTNGKGVKSIWVNTSSIVKRDQLTGVYVATPDNDAMLRWVRLGKEVGTQVEVLSGLNAEDRVIRQTDSKLHNGMKITLLN